MSGTRTKVALAATLIVVGGTASAAVAHPGGVERAHLDSFAEVPAISTPGNGTFRATVNLSTERVTYTLRYAGLTSEVTQAHIHFGRKATNGGVSAFLCTNIGGGTARTPACPQRGVVRGVLRRADILGPADQSIAAGQFREFVRAMRNGATYVNVHTSRFPAGEVRGQIGHRH